MPGLSESNPISGKPNKIKSFFSDEGILFVVKIFVFYGCWKALHYFIWHGPAGMQQGWGSIMYFMGCRYSEGTSFILNMFGEHTRAVNDCIEYIASGKRVYVVEHCLAIPATLIFTASILMYPGNWKNKLWFIPMGVAGVTFINLMRLVFLCATFEHFDQKFYDINHSLVYVIITYTLILLLIIWWMRKFAGETEKNPA